VPEDSTVSAVAHKTKTSQLRQTQHQASCRSPCRQGPKATGSFRICLRRGSCKAFPPSFLKIFQSIFLV